VRSSILLFPLSPPLCLVFAALHLALSLFQASPEFQQEGPHHLKYQLARLRREDELPLSRLAIPLDFFLGAKPVSLQHADADADAAAAQAAAAPASPPLRR
jgi:hypothetical protein